MDSAEERPRIEWQPSFVAAAIAMLLWWLAQSPFEIPEEPSGGHRVAAPAFALVAPMGELSAFPREFRWLPVPGAEIYEVTVTAHGADSPLFRQRGTTTILAVDVEPGRVPPPGTYVWEVVALRDGVELARSSRTFDVAP